MSKPPASSEMLRPSSSWQWCPRSHLSPQMPRSARRARPNRQRRRRRLHAPSRDGGAWGDGLRKPAPLVLSHVTWSRFFGQSEGLIQVYSGCRSCRQNPLGRAGVGCVVHHGRLSSRYVKLSSSPVAGHRQAFGVLADGVPQREPSHPLDMPFVESAASGEGGAAADCIPHLPPQGKPKLWSQPLPCRISKGEKSSVRMSPGFHAGALAVFKKDKTSGGILS